MAFTPLFGHQMLYGADYNPEQWLDMPEVLEADVKMMQQARCNIMSVGIFSWAKLEPEEGVFDFSWLDATLDRLHAHGIKVFLATPSGARPAWLAQKYPEVLRVNEQGQRALFGGRHNHCMTSPVYREKVKIINQKLAERYGKHPAVIGWHLSNEYGGSCHCPLCQEKFRQYLKDKYQTLENLNARWWNTFWSHTITDWSQIHSPSVLGEKAVHALNLDWQRFTSDNALDFCKWERDCVKAITPDLPVTANFMEFFLDYDYFQWAKELDFISWDSYPQWHVFKDPDYIASYTAMNHDLMRSLKGGQPWVLMESTPSCTNWRELSTLKRPGMNTLASLQAVAHGADSVQFFQWRKSRGSSEKFHGAIIDHYGNLDTRVGREACDLGLKLSKLGEICGSAVKAEVALVFDTQNRWAIDDAQGPRNKGMNYLEHCLDYYRAFYKCGIAVDVIDETCDLSKYKVVVAPLTYMLREGYAERVKNFVAQGGTYVSTCWSGIVDDTDLCFLGGFPGPLREVMGIWEEEIDSLDDGVEVYAKIEPKGAELCFNSVEPSDIFKGHELCGLVHPDADTEVLVSYDVDQPQSYSPIFYAGMPVLTRHAYGQGKAYYVASRMDRAFYDNLVQLLTADHELHNGCGQKAYRLAEGLSVTARLSDNYRYVFIGNYASYEQSLGLNFAYEDMLNEDEQGNKLAVSGAITLKPFEMRVLRRPINS